MPTQSEIIDRMIDALNDLKRLSHDGARYGAYQRAGIAYGQMLAFDSVAHDRQRTRRAAQTAADAVAGLCMFVGLGAALAVSLTAGDAVAAPMPATITVETAPLIVAALVGAVIGISACAGLWLFDSATRRASREQIGRNIKSERDPQQAARMVEG